MATAQLIASIPPLTLDAGCVITVEAIDATTGAAVSGVTITNFTITNLNDTPGPPLQPSPPSLVFAALV